MNTIELEISYPDTPQRPPDTEWVPEQELAETKAQIEAAGLRWRDCGPVSWQRQLAAMENSNGW